MYRKISSSKVAWQYINIAGKLCATTQAKLFHLFTIYEVRNIFEPFS